MPTSIKDWLASASRQLMKKSVPSARLDAEIILAHVLGKNRTYLHAHSDEKLKKNNIKTTDELLARRLNRTPIAYITGRKEFYGHDFIVDQSVLIPRPESEDIINILKSIMYNPKSTLRLVDVGTGSGILGITSKLEFPALQVTLTDISKSALLIARQNSKKLATDVSIVQSDLLESYDGNPDIILANLPYVSPDWKRSTETNYEPALALFAERNGQAIIENLLSQAGVRLKTNGFIIIEADPTQHQSLIKFANNFKLKKIRQTGYVITFQKTI